jgi:tRNA 2-thiocytidine biosynthesis protein TtcA
MEITGSPAVPPASLVRAVGRAIGDYEMIRAGDRVLVALSGGKDSLSLLHTLIHLRAKAPPRERQDAQGPRPRGGPRAAFELAAATVDPEIEGYDPSPMRAYVAALGLRHYYRREPIAERAKTQMQGDSFCAFCARMRRGILYRIAREGGYNVLALGQHLDDLAESFLMSAFHRGRLETMKAHYLNDAGDLRVIRPLLYARERQTAAFAASAGLPAIRDNCPACFRVPTERMRIKLLLAEQEKLYPHLFANLLHTMRPLLGTPPPAGAEAGQRSAA